MSEAGGQKCTIVLTSDIRHQTSDIMNINRNNYEEYFILYLDNELDSDDRRQVEAFAQENSDLKAELDMLLQSKLTPDNDIAFADKGSLMRFDNSSIGLANYEEWLTSYIDNELTQNERNDVEKFVAANPPVQKELNLLQQTKLQPEAIVFPYKESLYRKEEKASVVAVRWWKIAAAAVLLLGISTTAIVLINNKTGNDGVAKVQPKEEKPADNPVKQPGSETPVNEQVAVVNDQKKNEPVKKETSNSIAVKQKNIKEEKKEQPVPVKDEEFLFVNNNKENKPTNNLPQPDNSLNAKDNAKASADLTSKDQSLTKDIGNTTTADVTTHSPDTYNSTNEPDNLVKNPDVIYASQNSGGSNKGIRGFLRKITRTIEKRTNIKATDDDDRLLIAGVAIKMN